MTGQMGVVARKSWMRRIIDEALGTTAIAPTAEVTLELRNTGGLDVVPDLAMELAGKVHLTRGPHEKMTTFLERMRLKKSGRKPKTQTEFDRREYRMFASPGRVVDGPPRPTAPKHGAPLNTAEFTREKALLFSDGSFRIPGRRRLQAMNAAGDTVILSGRQLRRLRKTTRRNLKASQQEAVATA